MLEGEKAAILRERQELHQQCQRQQRELQQLATSSKSAPDGTSRRAELHARIAIMKDGSTHLEHKDEHAVDMGKDAVGAVLAVTVQGADQGDTTTWRHHLEEACANINLLRDDSLKAGKVHAQGLEQTVQDKGYHFNQTMVDLREIGLRSYTSEPDRPRRKDGRVVRRKWEGKEAQRQAVRANRRRFKGQRGRRLMRKRGELIEWCLPTRWRPEACGGCSCAGGRTSRSVC